MHCSDSSSWKSNKPGTPRAGSSGWTPRLCMCVFACVLGQVSSCFQQVKMTQIHLYSLCWSLCILEYLQVGATRSLFTCLNCFSFVLFEPSLLKDHPVFWFFFFHTFKSCLWVEWVCVRLYTEHNCWYLSATELFPVVIQLLHNLKRSCAFDEMGRVFGFDSVMNWVTFGLEPVSISPVDKRFNVGRDPDLLFGWTVFCWCAWGCGCSDG